MGAAGVVGGDPRSAALFDSSQLFCTSMMPRSHTSKLHGVSSPCTVPLEDQQQQQQQQQQHQSPETSSLFEDRLGNTSHLFCLPRTHSSHVQELRGAFRNDSDFEDALLHISSDFEDSMSIHDDSENDDDNDDDPLFNEHDDADDDSGLEEEEEELIGELRTPDIFVDDYYDFDDDYDDDHGSGGSSGGVLENSRPTLLDNVYSLYRESRFSHLNETKLGGLAGNELLSSSEARLKGQMEKFELLKAEMTKAANRHAADSMRKQVNAPCSTGDNEEEMRLQELKKKIEFELRQDENDMMDHVDSEDDSSSDGARDNDVQELPGCAEEKFMDEQGPGIHDEAVRNEETREDDAHLAALAKDVDLAHIQTDDVEVIHVDDGEDWADDSDLSSSDDSSLSAETGDDCASDDDSSSTSSSSSISENQLLQSDVVDRDWISDGLESLKLMGGGGEDDDQSDYCEDDGDGVSLNSFDHTIDLPENTLSFEFRDFPAASNISLLEALVSDIRALMIDPLRVAAEDEGELEWHERRDMIPSLTRDYELENNKHMSMTTVNTESTGCSSQATAETSSPVDSFLHDEGPIVTPLFMILLPLIAVNHEAKPAEVIEDAINDDEDVIDNIDDDDIELLSEEVNLDKHEATLSRRKRLLLRLRRSCAMCSENSRYR
jgi:hypothetical protein